MTATPKGTYSSTMLKTLLIMLFTSALIAGGVLAVLCGICTSDFNPPFDDKKSERDVDNDLG